MSHFVEMRIELPDDDEEISYEMAAGEISPIIINGAIDGASDIGSHTGAGGDDSDTSSGDTLHKKGQATKSQQIHD